MSEETEGSSVERRAASLKIKTRWGVFEFRGFSVLLAGLFVVNSLGVYVLWDHKEAENKEGTTLSKALSEVARSQREFACIISREGDERKRAFETGECRRQSRIGNFNGGVGE